MPRQLPKNFTCTCKHHRSVHAYRPGTVGLQDCGVPGCNCHVFMARGPALARKREEKREARLQAMLTIMRREYGLPEK